MIEPGAVIGHIRIDRVIGRGAMGVVFAGTHLELEQPVAVKVLIDECVAEPITVARFLREARAAARLRTEHVCRVFDVGRYGAGDAPYMVMELLAGEDLRQMMEREDIPVPAAVDYIAQACIALGEAHAAGIVHRDLKPANLFRTRGADGRVVIKVLDFGIAKAATAAEAKLTATASMIGTPAYTSPEQIRSARDVDLRTDIWALGATLYHLTTGRLPFMAERLADMAIKVMTAPPDPLPELDPGLAAVIARCLEKEPEQRYASVAELARALAPFGLAGTERNAQLAAPPTGLLDAQRMSGALAAPAPPLVQLSPQTAPSPAPVRSNPAIKIGVGVLGVGAAIGLIAALTLRHTEKAADRPPPAVETPPASGTTAGVAVAAPPAPVQPPAAVPVDAPGPKPQWKALPPRLPPVDPDTRKVDLKLLGEAEKDLIDHRDDPAIVEGAHWEAALNACELEMGPKAASHLAAVTDAGHRAEIVDRCLSHGITLE